MTTRPCPHRDLGQVTGNLIKASALIEQAAEILKAVGWRGEASALCAATRLLDGVTNELVIDTSCGTKPRDNRAA